MLKFLNFPPKTAEDVAFTADYELHIKSAGDEPDFVRELGKQVGSLLMANAEPATLGTVISIAEGLADSNDDFFQTIEPKADFMHSVLTQALEEQRAYENTKNQGATV
ncbi:MAG: hypothetical protein JWO35_587 [Candidatus Saccharibacteria bacterium]|nr:hypothetical protein [Candidatus Saccharibacteria bacterium]